MTPPYALAPAYALSPADLRRERDASLARRGIAPLPPPDPKEERPKPAEPGHREWWTTNDLAPHAGISAHTLRTHLERGDFPGAEKAPMPTGRGGYYWRIPDAAVRAWLAAREAARGYSIDELVQASGAHKEHIKKLIRQGKLPAGRAHLGGTKWRYEIPRAAADAWIASRKRRAA